MMSGERGANSSVSDSDHHQTNTSPGDTEKLLATIKGGFTYYTLPTVRYTNIFRWILFIDTVFSVCLWLTGGTSQYFTDNVLHFHLTESVFDLALLASLKIIPFFFILYKLEEITLYKADHPYERTPTSKKLLLHVLLILFSVLILAFTIVKGGLILYSFLNIADYQVMHLTYNILTISSVAFGLIEMLITLGSFRGMKKLLLLKIMHYVNKDGDEVDKEGKVKKGPVNLKRLLGLAKPELGILLIAIFCLIISSGSQIAAPLFFGQVVDAAQQAISTKSMDSLNRIVLILFLIYAGGAVAGMIRAWLFTLTGQRLVARLRVELFSSIIKQEVAFFDTNRTGELTNRLSSDTQVIQNAVTANISMLVRYMLQIIGSLAFMFILNPALTGVLLAVVPIISLSAVQYGRFVQTLQKKFQDRLADAGVSAEESISSLRTVRSFAGEKKVSDSYAVNIDKSYQMGKKLAFAQGGFSGIIGVVAYGAVSLVLWYGGKLVVEGHLTTGVLTSFLLYTMQVAMAFAFLTSLYGDFMKAVGASTRIFELLDRKPGVPIDQGLSLMELNGGIEFENVKFTYPSRPDTEVLRGVSFTVNVGQVVALVGPSGGGKSTIVSLIERFYDPEMGRIMLGGHDMSTLNPKWFRRQIAMVGQEPTLFACSIKDNIKYGRDATDDEVIQVAKLANAHDFILSFEDGYDTLVGERGVRLSGGQKQRVAIARALIMNPAILLLDEATSALDAESEHLVQEAIERVVKDRTVLVIAHRLSTVRSASQVLVIEKGKIVEQGTHESLIEQAGVYKKLVLRQLMAGNTQSTTESGTNGEETRIDT